MLEVGLSVSFTSEKWKGMHSNKKLKKGHLYSFVDMGHKVIGVIDMIDHIYISNYSMTDIYT